MNAQVGSTIELPSTQVGGQVRRGIVREVIAADPAELRVEWDDGHVSVIFPSAGMARLSDPKDA